MAALTGVKELVANGSGLEAILIKVARYKLLRCDTDFDLDAMLLLTNESLERKKILLSEEVDTDFGFDAMLLLTYESLKRKKILLSEEVRS